MSEPYRVPGILNPRLSVVAVDCPSCGKQVRMGPHSNASARRVIAAFGALCAACRPTVPDPPEGEQR